MAEALLEIANDPRKLEFADRWFQHMAWEWELTPTDRYDLKWHARSVGTQALREAIELGQRAGQEYRAAQEAYEAARREQAARQKEFPAELAERDPSTPLTIVAAHYDVRADAERYDNKMLDPLLDYITNKGRGGYILGRAGVNEPNRADELEAAGIRVLSLDEHHHELVKQTEYRNTYRLDAYKPNTLISLFGLTKEEHGAGPIVLLWDRHVSFSPNALAEAVHERTERYPIAAKLELGCPYEDTPHWVMTELFPPLAEPQRPDLQLILAGMQEQTAA